MLGGLGTALNEMRALLSLAPGQTIYLRRFPEMNLIKVLTSKPRNSNEEYQHAVGLDQVASSLVSSLRVVMRVFSVAHALVTQPGVAHQCAQLLHAAEHGGQQYASVDAAVVDAASAAAGV